jgi:hypothetical protein
VKTRQQEEAREESKNKKKSKLKFIATTCEKHLDNIYIIYYDHIMKFRPQF